MSFSIFLEISLHLQENHSYPLAPWKFLWIYPTSGKIISSNAGKKHTNKLYNVVISFPPNLDCVSFGQHISPPSIHGFRSDIYNRKHHKHLLTFYYIYIHKYLYDTRDLMAKQKPYRTRIERIGMFIGKC